VPTASAPTSPRKTPAEAFAAIIERPEKEPTLM
jgi:hypothetical protein